MFRPKLEDLRFKIKKMNSLEFPVINSYIY